MLFSDAFGISRDATDDWFDPLLNIDTRLFLDPFLLYDGESGVFTDSHAEIIQFFNFVLGLIAKSDGDDQSASWRLAESLLRFPEVGELCLGYTKLGTRGSGSGGKLAVQLARGFYKAVRAGVKELSHFEEIQIFEEGIGADRISDATANIIRHRLAEYTRAICRKHKIPTVEVRTDRGFFDIAQQRWVNRTFELPINPLTKNPILLVPRQYLRKLPAINADAFWDYCYDNQNDLLRQRYGDDIKRNVDKATIVDLARAAQTLRSQFIKTLEARPPAAYDIERDPNGLYQPGVDAFRRAKAHPHIVSPKSDKDMAEAVFEFIEDFRIYVEDNKGWKLLWNDNGTSKGEDAFQALFMQTVATHCRFNNIDVSAEANIGRGPVDFKMSYGYSARVLIEAKLAKNSKFWNGLRRQLPKYLEAERISEGIFVVCAYKDEDIKKISDIQKIVDDMNKSLPYKIRVITIDARRSPPSASLL